MEFSKVELLQLAGRASALGARWAGGVASDGADSRQVHVRLQQWQRVLSIEGDSRILARRLGLDGLDLESCPSWLGPVKWANDECLPVWAERLNALLERCGGIRDTETLSANGDTSAPTADDATDGPLPFRDLWLPFVIQATADLRSRAGTSLDNLAEAAVHSIQTQLLEVLVRLAALPLALEFRLFIARRDPLSISEQPGAQASRPSDDLYRRFVQDLLRGGLLDFFLEYAVLARLVAQVIEYWQEQTIEFCHRLDEDRPALAERFNGGQDLGPVVDVKLGRSDPHHRGRMVVITTFAAGSTVVYKPRDLGIDAAFWGLVDWLNERSGLLPLRSLEVLNRTTHGWVEFADHQPCQEACEVERYYRRLGMLLCLAYAFGGTDNHLENIIASGEHPVLVDLETMLQPMPHPWDARQLQSADQRALELVHNSVLRTGLLPIWMVGNLGNSFDISGMGAEDKQDTGYRHPHWLDVNTDRMRLVYRNLPVDPESNRLVLNGKIVSVRDYAGEIADGFRALYQFLIARRDEVLADNGPLTRFRGLKLRCVLRGTHVYACLSHRLLHPEFLRDGADRSLELERLAQVFLVNHPDPDEPPPWNIYRAEIDALERMDVPYFNIPSDANLLEADGRIVASGFHTSTGLDSVASRLRHLSEKDLDAQTSYIHASLYARFTDRPLDRARRQPPGKGATDADYGGQPATSLEQDPPLGRSALIAAAETIASQIRAQAILGADGGATWFSLCFNTASERMNLSRMDDNLYDGRLGVALFLAALEHIADRPGYRDLALAAILPLRNALEQPVSPAAGRSKLGGASGFGSQLYGLVRIADLLDDDELYDCARRIVDWFLPQRITRDSSFDVIDGTAGGILGLLAVSEARANGKALEVAVQCGDHLLQNREVTDTAHRAWRVGWAPRSLTGFSHGAAGIAYALLRLSHATGENRFRDAAEEAIAYETAMYCPDARNWPDLRDRVVEDEGAGDRYMVAWCHGATGIGLGRLGGLPVLDALHVRQDIANALATTLATPDQDWDHLCCGNLDASTCSSKHPNAFPAQNCSTKPGDAPARLFDEPSGPAAIGCMPRYLASPTARPCFKEPRASVTNCCDSLTPNACRVYCCGSDANRSAHPARRWAAKPIHLSSLEKKTRTKRQIASSSTRGGAPYVAIVLIVSAMVQVDPTRSR